MAPEQGRTRPDPGFGLKISPNVVLRNLLQQYPSGGQFFLEALQNADDTGRARKFCALLDLRRHPVKALREPVENRAFLQNEAIVFYDDAGFKDRDWRSLQFMCDSEKRQSPHEAGAFGMGSRSFFHITDVLQVLSGTRLAALDPDDLLCTGHFGEQVDFAEEGLLERYPDECAPFRGVFGCDMRSEFRGSLIRASLRSADRAQKCTFMPHAFDLSRAQRIFAEFEDTLRNGEVILFLTCVACVELWRWDAGATEPSVIARARLGVSSGHTLPQPMAGPRDVKAYLEQFETFAELTTVLRQGDPSKGEPPEILDVVEMETLVVTTGRTTTQKWLRCGAFSKEAAVLDMVDVCCCVPLVALALPLGGPCAGALFASLPLPLPTGLPVHINAFFRLHDNRRAIWRLTPDLDGEHKMWAQWNDWILTRMVPVVYARSLGLLASVQGLAPDRGHAVWPAAQRVEKEFSGILDPLVLALKESPLLPTPRGHLALPRESIWFPTPSAALSSRRGRLLELCAERGLHAVDPPEHVVDLLHARGALERRSCEWVFWEVLLPAAPTLQVDDLGGLLLALMDFAGSWREAEVLDLRSRLEGVRWVPTEGGQPCAVAEAFDPAADLGAFKVVKERRAAFGKLLEGTDLSADAVWRVLRQCGLKSELTWSDVADEVASVASDGDVSRAALLLSHVNAKQSSMPGDRLAALPRLRELAWLPASRPGPDAAPPARPAQLLTSQQVFAPSAHRLLWAVAPTLCEELRIPGLEPGRSVEAEPEVLIDQVRALAQLDGAPHVPAEGLEHMRITFGALLPLLSRLPSLSDHPKLRGVAFVPCQPADGPCDDGAGDDGGARGAVLFAPRCAAFGSQQGRRALSPVVGLVLSSDQTFRMIAEAAGVPKEPRADVLAEALSIAAPSAALAVSLAVELAARLRAKEPRPERLLVPTACGAVEPVEVVHVDDAPWRREQRDVVTLHPGIAADDGRLLGCRSLREKMARECEEELPAGDVGEDTEHGDDPVGRVRKLLQDLGDSASLASELMRHADEAGAACLSLVLHEEAFGTERLLNPRASELQGRALYVCMDKVLSVEDLQRLRRFGNPAGVQDGVASLGSHLNVMYRYCDCPQLLSGGLLYYFDITQSFVTRPDDGPRRRCRAFSLERLRERFPDSHAPLQAAGLAARFPTIFRLALRGSRSELGLAADLGEVRADLRRVAVAADKMLLFSRHLRRVEFRDGSDLLAAHEVSVRSPSEHEAFFQGLAAACRVASGAAAAAPGPAAYLAQQTITTQGPEATCVAEWAVAHCAGAPDDGSSRQQLQELGATLSLGAPYGAAAVRIKPAEEESRGGRLCVAGVPTSQRSGSAAWLAGAFAQQPASAGAPPPLPASEEAAPSPEQRWNRLLLEGPVAESLRNLIIHCTELLLKKGLDVARYFALFPAAGDRLQTLLAAATYDLDFLHSKVVLRAAAELQGPELASLLLALLEWASGWKEAEIRALGEKLSGLCWLPTEGGVPRAVVDAFDPTESPGCYGIVRERRAKIGDVLAASRLDQTSIWHALLLCGLKRELTWEDVVDEAERIRREGDIERATLLLEHVNARHASLRGGRAAATEQLRALPWVPASRPCAGLEPAEASQLLALRGAFPPSAHRFVWAVAPALRVEPAVEELRACRSVDAEPEVLVEQVRALADAAAASSRGLPQITAAGLEHLQAAFGALLPLLSKLPCLAEHPRLVGVSFIPCLATGDEDAGATLFTPARAAFRAQHDHRALSPVLGVVKPTDPTIRMIAEAAGVTKEPRAAVLAEALCRTGLAAPTPDLAVALSVELAARLRAGEEPPPKIMVPTVLNTVESANYVYIDDAPWQHQRKIVTLHPRISAEDGRLLGCSSLRDEMARQCEEDPAAAVDGDAFGQEADLVSQVRQLLQEYGESADLVAEFVQNSDDAGAREVAFLLRNETFASERVVDPRTSSLQGPALYICSDKPLSAEDISRMQCVGHSKKRLDFGSSGRFGVGLNVMYRYCDCPQLLANNCLHFFDLTRSFVAKEGMKRGRQFTVQKLQENFPDSHAPFELKELVGRYPTVFRLALRTERTELGLKMDQTVVKGELKKASAIAEKLLLFARNLRRLEFHDHTTLIAAHEAVIHEPDKYHAFFSTLPTTLPELRPGPLKAYLALKTITREIPGNTTAAEWAIAHRVGVLDDSMLQVLKEQFEQPHGVALLPHGAAAVRVNPVEDEPRAGRICCGPPTPFRSGSGAWLQGSFALLSSRKALPLPEEEEAQPSLDKRWNKMLLDGPIAWSMRGIITHCTALVSNGAFPLDRFFALFPIRGERLQTILAVSTWKAAMNQAVFPVCRNSEISWAQGPTPTFFSLELAQDLQESLVNDGLNLVRLPSELVTEYEEALGRPREMLKGKDLCDFLRTTFQKLHPGGRVPEREPESTAAPEGAGGAEKGAALELNFPDTKMACLSKKPYIFELLRFAVRGIWADFCAGRPKDFYKFVPEALAGVPLLVTHAQQVTTFCASTKFYNWRDVLPEKKSLFLSRETYCAVMESVDTAVQGIERVVETEIPGVRGFTLNDLLPYREEVENAVNHDVGFMDVQNEALRVFWSLVAETFAEDHQIAGYDVFTAAQARAWEARERKEAKARGEIVEEPEEPATAAIGDRSWCRLIRTWHVLPICSKSGGGENGEDVVSLEAAGMCVAVTLIDQDPKVVKSLTAILQECGIDTVQHDVMSDNRISRLLRTIVVTTNDDMLSLLIEHSNVDNLSGVQRHDLLAYFAVLCVKGERAEVRISRVGQLPLFKTAAIDSKFIALKKDTQYCCVDPSDPHANALSKLMPPGMVMLAWPTSQIKPIYEHLGIQLCNGEEAMVSLIIPRLPAICVEDDDGTASGPFLLELHAYSCIDRSITVMRAAAETAFISSEDATRVGAPPEFTSPAGRCAAAFRESLGAFLPVWWMQQNPTYMELLHALGMMPFLSPSMILLCALELDLAAEAAKEAPSNPDSAVSVQAGNELLRMKSFELVEEFARAAEEVWPKKSTDPPRASPAAGSSTLLALQAPSVEDNIKAMSNLLEASSLRILMAKRHKTERSKREDAARRNARLQRQAAVPLTLEDGAQTAEVELVAFRGVAFRSAKNVLWTVAPLADHRPPPGSKDTQHLKNLLERHSGGIFQVFGSYVQTQHPPPDLVIKHLSCLCTLMQTEPGLACVKVGSVLLEDLKACWNFLADHLTNPPSDTVNTPECLESLNHLRALPCVAVTSEDVADRPADVLNLTLPKYAFFQLPLLKGREATLKLYLRQVHAETTREAAVFRTLGASDVPRAADYADASERVALKAEELGRANWEWVVAVLDACVRGVYEDLASPANSGSAMNDVIPNLHLFTSNGSIAPAISLVWADEPRWQKRCEKSGALRFCALKDSPDVRDVAMTLVRATGLRQLTALVEERRVVEYGDEESEAKGVKESVESLVRSFEFARGLHAVILHNHESSERAQKHTLASVSQELRKIKFKATRCKLRSGLFRKAPLWRPGKAAAAAKAPAMAPPPSAPPVMVPPPGAPPEAAAASAAPAGPAEAAPKEGEAAQKEGEAPAKAAGEGGTSSGGPSPAEAEAAGAEAKTSSAPAEGANATPGAGGSEASGAGAADKGQEGDSQAAPQRGGVPKGKEECGQGQGQSAEPAAPAETAEEAAASTLIPGSEQDQQVYFDAMEKAVYIGGACEGPAEDTFTAELVFALRHALPLLFEVDSFLLEALLRCAFKDGPEGIPAFLEKRDIKVDTLAPRHLGPGDALPEDLQENLVWSMHATFGEGENAAVLHRDVFIIAEVSKWPDQKQPGDGLSKSYLVRIGADTFEPKKHFEVYKIHSRSSSSTSLELALIPDEGAMDKDPTMSVGGAGQDEEKAEKDLKHLTEVKQYLREMANMSQEDYKTVMRRLFKTWHPDKVGDTPVANKIFHMLRMHEQWYKRRIAGEAVGDDSWLDKEDLGSKGAGKGKGGPSLLALTGRTYEPAEGGQSSWFDEFEREIQQAKVDKESGKKRKEHPRMPEAADREEPMGVVGAGGWTGPTRQSASDGPHRMVDRQLSARFLQEAKLELVVARRLLREMDGLRSVPPRAVFHCQQAVEMGLNSAMLRTCGVSEDEVAGGAAHDLIDFIKRIKAAEVNTAEQRRAQQVPINEEDVDWLKRAYLASRYPKPGRWGVPSLLYDEADAQRALRLAERFVEWAERVEDLPDPGKSRRKWAQFEESKTVPGDSALPTVPRYVPPPLVLPPPIKRSEPASGSGGLDERAGKVARSAESQDAFAKAGSVASSQAPGASDGGPDAKRQRTAEASLSAGIGGAVAAAAAAATAAAASGTGGGDAGATKRWARRLRTG